MSAYTAVDVSQLPFPGIVEELSFDAIYQEMRDQMNALQPMLFNEDGAAKIVESELIENGNGDKYFRVPFAGETELFNLELESDPSARQLQIVAFREMLIRQRVNEACKGVMLAYAVDADLEQIAAGFGVFKKLITPADEENGIEAVYESNEDFRRRIQLASEGFSTAGPEGAYIFHALSANSDVKDASAQSPTFDLVTVSQEIQDQLPEGAIVIVPNDDVGLTDPMPGDVAVNILSHTGNGAAPQATQDAVKTSLNEDDVRPMTDRVRERSAQIIDYEINATLYTYAGPDSSVVLQNAQEKTQTFVDANHKLGRDINVSGVYAALHQPGVQRVETDFNQNIVCDRSQAAYCTGINITHGGVAD
ncbi:MAG: baseplate J/gp47 family protein [Oceanospirillaceae bacterium]|nr:baseplate J/gp47 family protein [Oceanospirillaceae bacterium]